MLLFEAASLFPLGRAARSGAGSNTSGIAAGVAMHFSADVFMMTASIAAIGCDIKRSMRIGVQPACMVTTAIMRMGSMTGLGLRLVDADAEGMVSQSHVMTTLDLLKAASAMVTAIMRGRGVLLMLFPAWAGHDAALA